MEGGIGKDAPGGGELEVDLSEVPAAEEEDHGDEEKAGGSEGDEDAIDQQKPGDGQGNSSPEESSTARIHRHRGEFEWWGAGVEF